MPGWGGACELQVLSFNVILSALKSPSASTAQRERTVDVLMTSRECQEPIKYDKRLPVIALLHLGENIGSLVNEFSKIVTRTRVSKRLSFQVCSLCP